VVAKPRPVVSGAGCVGLSRNFGAVRTLRSLSLAAIA
jgi:hypothetical protein